MTTIRVFDFILEDFATELADALDQAGRNPVHVLINSEGGIVDQAIAGYELLRTHPAKVTVDVIGIAASAAAVFAMGADTVRIARHAMFMIHNPLAMVVSNARELRKMASVLDQYADRIRNVFASKTGQPMSRIKDWMDGETFMSADVAQRRGFADEVISASSTATPNNKTTNRLARPEWLQALNPSKN
ncbi:MAG: Clp protease ClpP [Pirellulales bacterium]|nr:Clp protease ClpP [Pirellulales bacterium]